METATKEKEAPVTPAKKKPRAKRKQLDLNVIMPTDFESGDRWAARNTETRRRETMSMHNNFGTPMYYVHGTPYRQFENALDSFKILCGIMGANLLVRESAK